MINKNIKFKPEKLSRPDWLQIWAGSWSLLSCSHFAIEYIRLIRFHGRPFLPETVVVVHNGKSQGWARQRDREDFCRYLAKEITSNPKRVAEICATLKERADNIRGFLRINSKSTLTAEIFNDYFEELVAYYQPHINVKYVVDGLSPSQLKKFFPQFEEARVYAETVLAETERFLEQMAKQIGKKEKLLPSLVLCCTYQEIENYLNGHALPKLAVLQERDQDFAVFADQKQIVNFSGQEAKQVEEIITQVKSSEILQGTVAQKGKVIGQVRVVNDPKKASNFKTGDILVASMTRPEFLPLMKKAAAFVTDSGGLLSHAAITARELKKPCIIGTKVATKVFNNGDLVEVDANKGVVKILSPKGRPASGWNK